MPVEVGLIADEMLPKSMVGTSAGTFDIDGGVTSIRSPDIALPSTGTLTLSIQLLPGSREQRFDGRLPESAGKSGATNTIVFQRLGAATNINGAWAATSVSLSSFAGQAVTILIEAADASGASFVEAGIDDVRVLQQ